MTAVCIKIATFAAGGFWDAEAAFRSAPGVTNTVVGYSGGDTPNPRYRDICSGKTGHAEVVRVEYDADATSYEALLEVFWSCHDPTQRSRLGPQERSQYRSAIFFHDASQEHAAKAAMTRLKNSGRFSKPLLTLVEAVGPFYLAEDYHQQYLERRGATG